MTMAIRACLVAVVMAFLGGTPLLAQTGSVAPTPEVLKELAPSGRLRAAINLGNAVLAQGTVQEPRGITVDLAREMARRIGLPLDLVPFDAAGKVFDALKAGAWDVAFIAIEPARAAEIEFSSPYVLIEGTYMVRNDSPLKVIGDVDKPGIRIAVGRGSAYDLFLTRTLKAAELVRYERRLLLHGGDVPGGQDGRRRRREAAARAVRHSGRWPARHGRPLPGDPPGDGRAERAARCGSLRPQLRRGRQGVGLRQGGPRPQRSDGGRRRAEGVGRALTLQRASSALSSAFAQHAFDHIRPDGLGRLEFVLREIADAVGLAIFSSSDPVSPGHLFPVKVGCCRL